MTAWRIFGWVVYYLILAVLAAALVACSGFTVLAMLG